MTDDLDISGDPSGDPPGELPTDDDVGEDDPAAPHATPERE
jgi:hypothetical protein